MGQIARQHFCRMLGGYWQNRPDQAVFLPLISKGA